MVVGIILRVIRVLSFKYVVSCSMLRVELCTLKIIQMLTPVNATAFGNKIFGDVISLDEVTLD